MLISAIISEKLTEKEIHHRTKHVLLEPGEDRNKTFKTHSATVKQEDQTSIKEVCLLHAWHGLIVGGRVFALAWAATYFPSSLLIATIVGKTMYMNGL